eukprot:6201544-Amphidinium_carterae.1
MSENSTLLGCSLAVHIDPMCLDPPNFPLLGTYRLRYVVEEGAYRCLLLTAHAPVLCQERERGCSAHQPPVCRV